MKQKTKIDQWMDVANNPDQNLAEKGLHLARIVEYPDLDMGKYMGMVRDIGEQLREAVGDVKNPTYLISMLNEQLFDIFGLVGDDDDYYNPQNSFVNDVLDKKSGLPITISIIYVEVAKHVGLDLQLVGFPSHVLVKFNEELIIDPFYGGRILGAGELQEILDANLGGLELVPEFLDSISEKKILVRMTRNLKNAYMQSYAFEKACLCMDLAMSLEAGVPEDARDMGIIKERLSDFESALSYLNRYLELRPDAQDADAVLDLIKSIRMRASR